MTAAVSATYPNTPPQAAAVSWSAASDDASLLPDGQPISNTDLNDALSSLYALMSELRVNEMKDGQADVASLKEQQEKAIADIRAAIARRIAAEASSGDGFFASIGHFFEDVVDDVTSGKFDKVIQDATKDVEAAWNSPAFWNDLEQGLLAVAKVAGAVGAAAATVVTAGAAGGTLLVVALVLSAGGMAVADTGCLDGALGQGWSSKIGFAMELGGAVLTTGTSFAPATTGGLQTLENAGSAASATGGAASAGAGVAHVRVGDFQADAQEASADALVATQQNARLGRLIEQVVEEMKQSDQSAETKGESIVDCEQTNDQTMALATPAATR
jgi:hypothetical protein